MKLHDAIVKAKMDNPSLSNRKIAKLVGCSDSTVWAHLHKAGITEPPKEYSVDDAVVDFREKKSARNVKHENKVLVERIVELEEQLELTKCLKANCRGSVFIPKAKGNRQKYATAFAIASDWHSEERVRRSTTNGLNEFDLEIAHQRIERFFQNTVKLLEAKQKNININTLVLALLGDFISGSIHDDTMESALLPPSEALCWVFGHVASGIKFLLKNTSVNLIIPCHSGNHGRFTMKQRIANEAGNSYEYLSYHFLAKQFEGEKRVQFLVSEGYHSFMDINGFIIRFHHGHFVKYQGGVGGIYIPAHKAINEWNKGNRADLDVFGHFHQQIFSPMFVCNGSLIGFSPYAVSIKAPFQKPMQAFFLVHHERKQVIDQCPIWLD